MKNLKTIMLALFAITLLSVILSSIASAKVQGYEHWCLPLEKQSLLSYVSSSFGEKRGYTNDQGKYVEDTHTGIDFYWGSISGETIYAVDGGVVVYAGYGSGVHYGFGNMVLINHGNGRYTLYAHMNDTPKVSVSTTPISQGTPLGNVGRTGNVTGIHLHFEVRSSAAQSTAVNPKPYLEDLPVPSQVNPFADNKLVNYGGSVYRMAGGAPLYVDYDYYYNKIGAPGSTGLTEAQWNQIKDNTPANGTIVRAHGGGVYQFASGRPYHVANPDRVNGGSCADVSDWLFHPANRSNPMLNFAPDDLRQNCVKDLSGYYSIKMTVTTKSVIDGTGANATAGAKLHLWEKAAPDHPWQIFKFEKQSDDTYKITSKDNGLSFDVQGFSMKVGTDGRIAQYGFGGQDNQKWYIFKNSDGSYRFISKFNGMCIDVHEGKTANGTPIVQYWDNGSGAQKFTLTKRQYDIKYDKNTTDTVSDMPSTSQTKIYGDTLTLRTNRPKRTNYDFMGWATTSTGAVKYQPGDSYTSNTSATLYAVWKGKEYEVTYNLAGGMGDFKPQAKIHGTDLELYKTTPTKDGYVFSHWTDGTNTYNPGDKYIVNAALKLTAVWIPDTYAVLFIVGEGVNLSGLFPIDTKTHGVDYIIPAINPTRPGFIFAGWEAIIFPGGKLDQLFIPGGSFRINKSVSFIPKWIEEEVFVKGDINGDGVVDMADVQLGMQIIIGQPVPNDIPDGWYNRGDVDDEVGISANDVRLILESVKTGEPL